MRTVSFVAVLDRLNEAIDFCTQVGLDARQSRFFRYRERIAELLGALSLRPLSLQRPDYEYVVPLCEATEFGDAVEVLKHGDIESLRGKLRAVLKGPFLPIDEDDATSLSRNTLFELTVAARLTRAGFHAVIGDSPDVSCSLQGKDLLFECKRVASASKIRTRIKEAEKQLRDDLTRARPGSRGAIAVSVSKVLNPGDKFLAAEDEASLRREFRRRVEDVAERVRPRWAKYQGTDIVVVWFSAITPSLVREPGMYVVSQQMVSHSFGRRAIDSQLLKELEAGLMRTHS